MRRIRRGGFYRGTVSVVTAFAFYMSLGAPYVARAQEADPVQVDPAEGSDDSAAASRDVQSYEDLLRAREAAEQEEPAEEPSDDQTESDATQSAPVEQSNPVHASALPSGSAKSAVTPQAISLPNAEGSIEGMGESFTPNLSAGTGTFTVPISLPPGRAGVQPSLTLAYSTSAGNGPVGIGWDLAYPFISRQTDKGLPRYVSNGGRWHEEEDTFMYNGGQELVPVDNAAATAVDGAPVPVELADWQQYRARVEGAFMRFFRSPDALRWVVQDKSGARFDFGLLDDGEGPAEAVTGSTEALQSEFENGQGRVFSWALTRMSDSHGSTVYYQYFNDSGRRYLEHVFYVSPASCAASSYEAQRNCSQPLSSYGRHVHLVYETREDAFDSYVTTWRVTTGLRLRRIEVTAMEADAAERSLVRRYHLSYDPSSFLSLLSELQVEGRPDALSPRSQVMVGDRHVPESSLDDAIVGRTLPPMTFGYTTPNATTPGVDGFPGINGTPLQSSTSPPHSTDEARSDLFDVNSDGLPDLIVTDPARYQTEDGSPAVGVFFNGFTGPNARPAQAGEFSEAIPVPMPPGSSSTMNLGNLNITPMDIDGDGRSDLLHMPRLANYGYFTPTREPAFGLEEVSPADQGWRFSRVPVALPNGEIDPRIDFGRDSAFIKTLDVNNDHLIDVVRTTGTVMQTWLNLGRYPGGDGLFGSATFTGGSWRLSTEPLESCLLQDGLPVDFEDPELRIADMNGDGIQDIVKIRRGDVVYWPGRGPGLWGAGAASCARGEGDGREVVMSSPPQEINVELAGVSLDDVNHDGAADVVQVRYDAVDVWFNEAGHAFTARVVADETPYAPAFAPAVRFADIDGTGTTDIVYAHGNDWQWIDPMGGRKPRLLERVENGLGAVTELEYASSAEDYLRDLAGAETCVDSSCDRFDWNTMTGTCDEKVQAASGECVHRSGGSPVVSTVVRSVTTRDQFDQIGREGFVRVSRFAYHDAYYEGIEQEFRGFGAADAIAVGDAAQPTSIARSRFHQGRRPAEIASDRLADNPNEALKGRAFMTEVFDERGVYLSTMHSGLTVRRMLSGLNGFAVSYAFVHRTDDVRYDTAPFMPSGDALLGDPLNAGTFEFASVLREIAGAGPNVHGPASIDPPDLPAVIPLRGLGYAHMVSTVEDVDNVGNMREQTAHGRVRGEFGETPNEAIISHSEPVRIDPSSSGQWLWRTGESFVTGDSFLTQDENQLLSHSIFDYNAAGDPIVTTQPVTVGSSVPALSFAGDTTGAAGYPFTPEDAVSSAAFDTWGNSIRVCAGGDLGSAGTDQDDCMRFSAVEFDGAFQQFAIGESLAVAGLPGAFTELVTTGIWDQGLSTLLTVIDPNELETEVEYDGLGRLSSLTPPNVYSCDGADVPLTRIAYELAAGDAPINVITTTTEQSCAGVGADPLVVKGYVDGLGRTRATAVAAEDPDDPAVATRVQRSGIMTLNAKGGTREAFQPDLLDVTLDALSPSIAVALPSGIPSTLTTFDAFDRPTTTITEDGAPSRTYYHALSQDAWDPLDLDPGSPNVGTPATQRNDGHGRVIDSVLRNRKTPGGLIEVYRLFTDYRADGQVVHVQRAETTSDAPRGAASIVPNHSVERTFYFDNRGRRVGSTDPDTDNLAAPLPTRGWRYLFNRVDDLVAVRDPRGCGQNFFYDRAGRLVGEDYVQCAEAQVSGELPPDTVPAGTIALDGILSAASVDARYYFDEYPAWSDPSQGFAIVPSGANRTLGRATARIDRGQRSVLAYDNRGNVIWQSRQMAVIPNAYSLALTLANPPTVNTADTITTRAAVYNGETYVIEQTFDHAGRARAVRMPEDPDYAGVPPRVGGTVDFNVRSLPRRASLIIDNTAQPIVARIDYTRDGLPARITHGDTVGGTHDATISETQYDVRRRPVRAFTVREPTSLPDSNPVTGRPLGAVSVVADQRMRWDAASNLIGIDDLRDGSEWRNGFRPQSYTVRHDALYRVSGVEYDYNHDDGTRTPNDPFVDYRDQLEVVEPEDPMRTDPAPMLPAVPAGRVVSLTYEHDWLANMVDWTDDAGQFYERSLGRITNGAAEPGDRPSALRFASDLSTAPPGTYNTTTDRGGYAEVDYGVGGNVVAMTVHAQCHDTGGQVCYDPEGSTIASRRTQLRTRCECEAEQHYQYRWDELNRLSDARRYDRPGGTGDWSLVARQRARYDSANQRTVKHVMTITSDVTGEVQPNSTNERIALYIYPDDFERRGLSRSESGGIHYEANTTWETESQYLVGGARIVTKSGGMQVAGQLDRDLRVTAAITDVIHSTIGVIDLVSGALVELSTFYPNGARESYRAPDGPGDVIAAEPMAFTAKEADEEVGLTYFGERYLMTRLGRWATPDPLHVHALGGGEALDSYHYVGGNLLQQRDPLGLNGEGGVWTFDATDMESFTDEDMATAMEDVKATGYGMIVVKTEGGITAFKWNSNNQKLEYNEESSANWTADPTPYEDRKVGEMYQTVNMALCVAAGPGLVGGVAGGAMYTAAFTEVGTDVGGALLAGRADNLTVKQEINNAAAAALTGPASLVNKGGVGGVLLETAAEAVENGLSNAMNEQDPATGFAQGVAEGGTVQGSSYLAGPAGGTWWQRVTTTLYKAVTGGTGDTDEESELTDAPSDELTDPSETSPVEDND